MHSCRKMILKSFMYQCPKEAIKSRNAQIDIFFKKFRELFKNNYFTENIPHSKLSCIQKETEIFQNDEDKK